MSVTRIVTKLSLARSLKLTKNIANTTLLYELYRYLSRGKPYQHLFLVCYPKKIPYLATTALDKNS